MRHLNGLTPGAANANNNIVIILLFVNCSSQLDGANIETL